MKLTVSVLCLLVVCQLALATGNLAEGNQQMLVSERTAGKTTHSPAIRNNVPVHQTGTPFAITPTDNAGFMFSPQQSIMVKQPSPAGQHTGNGIYFVFHSRPGQGHPQRAYYAYLEDGNTITSQGLLHPTAPAEEQEAHPFIAMDDDTGNPVIIFRDEQGSVLCYDLYDSIGFPGIFHGNFNVFSRVPELISLSVIRIGDSPQANMKRIYLAAMTISGSKHIAYRDYHHFEDLSPFQEEDWTVYQVPLPEDWNLEEIRLFDDFVVTDDGKAAFVGMIRKENYHQDALFALINSNYGEGDTTDDWVLYETSANIIVPNPDGWFGDNEDRPRSLYVSPVNPRFNALVADDNSVLMPLTYRLFIPGETPVPVKDQAYIKTLRFDFETDEFSITDIYPRSTNPDAFPFLPWDPDGDGTWNYHHTPEDSFLVVTQSWPLRWWDDVDYLSENYVHLASTGKYLVMLFQESMNSRYWNEYDLPEYEDWANISNTYLVISDDYGQSWYDPIILNSKEDDDNFDQALSGKIPSFWRSANLIDITNGDNPTLLLHTAFLDRTHYHHHLPLTGWLTYLPIEISFNELSAEPDLHQPGVSLSVSNYPNPFNPETTIRFNLPANGKVELDVFNVKGQVINKLLSDNYPAGEHSVVWNGKDANDREVGSGVYLYRLQTSQTSETKKMLLLR